MSKKETIPSLGQLQKWWNIEWPQEGHAGLGDEPWDPGKLEHGFLKSIFVFANLFFDIST